MGRDGTHKSSRSCCVASDRPERPNRNRNVNYPLRFHENLPCFFEPPFAKAAPAARAPVVPDRHDLGIMVNFWRKVNHHEVVYDRITTGSAAIRSLPKLGPIEDRKMRRRSERGFSPTCRPMPPERGDSCVRGRTEAAWIPVAPHT